MYIVEHDDTHDPTPAIQEMVKAHNEHFAWLKWYTPEKELMIAGSTRLAPESCYYAHRARLTQPRAVLCTNRLAAAETSLDFLQSFVRERQLPYRVHMYHPEMRELLLDLPRFPSLRLFGQLHK